MEQHRRNLENRSSNQKYMEDIFDILSITEAQIPDQELYKKVIYKSLRYRVSGKQWRVAISLLFFLLMLDGFVLWNQKYSETKTSAGSYSFTQENQFYNE